MLVDKNTVLLPHVPSTLEVQNRKGTVIEVRFDDGVWYLGRLLKRARGWHHEGPPRWWVEFDDGEVINDIWTTPA